MSWRRFCKTSWRGLENVLKMSWWHFERRLENVLKTSWRRMTKTIMLVLLKTSWRRLLKTYVLGEYIGLDQDVLKTSWRRLLKAKTKEVFKTSSGRLHEDEYLLGYNFHNLMTFHFSSLDNAMSDKTMMAALETF